MRVIRLSHSNGKDLHVTDQDRVPGVIHDVAEKVRRFQDRSLGEQNTKASLIEPVLEALGWDIRDPDEVHREFKPTSQDKPVDYCLTLLRKPRLLVEAKGLGETLTDRKWIGQILGYAAVAGVEWCVLTDGNVYRFYNATVALDAEEKLFFQITLSDGRDEEAAEALKLVSRNNMAENILEVLWNAHYVDRRVRHALQAMFESRDKGLVRLIRKKVSKLTPKEILESLRRLDVHIGPGAAIPEARSRTQANRPTTKRVGGKQPKDDKIRYDVRLADIIAAALLSPPVKLFREYKGRMLEATLLADGKVEFNQTRYKTGSTAAETARAAVTGRKMNTNGWVFWQYVDTAGKTQTLADARRAFLARKER
jgi:hypothetical protein